MSARWTYEELSAVSFLYRACNEVGVNEFLQGNEYYQRRYDADDDTGEDEEKELTEEEEKSRKRKRLLVYLSPIPAVISVIVFLLTEDMTKTIAITDRWTILMAVLLLIQLILLLFSKKKNQTEEENEEGAME